MAAPDQVSQIVARADGARDGGGPVKRAYASEQMIERRERILRAARDLLSFGAANLTINRLCEMAQVAPRTVYRAFGDRDGVIEATISAHMNRIRTFLVLSPADADLDAIFREYDWIVAELFRGPDFARVIVDFYFSQRPRAALLASMRSVARARIERWLALAGAAGDLLPGLENERIVLHQVDGEYAVFHNWAAGLLPDDKVGRALKLNFAMTAAAVTTGAGRERIVAFLRLLQGR